MLGAIAIAAPESYRNCSSRRIARAGEPTITATGTFALKRLAYKIGENEWADTSMVADDVQVKFKLALTGVGKL